MHKERDILSIAREQLAIDDVYALCNGHNLLTVSIKSASERDQTDYCLYLDDFVRRDCLLSMCSEQLQKLNANDYS